MVALVLEAYGLFCLFSLIAFLIWAAMAKLRLDLDEENFEGLEKLTKVASCRPSDAPAIDELIIEELSRAAPAARPVKAVKRPIHRRPIHRRPIHRRPRLIHSHKPRMI